MRPDDQTRHSTENAPESFMIAPINDENCELPYITLIDNFIFFVKDMSFAGILLGRDFGMPRA